MPFLASLILASAFSGAPAIDQTNRVPPNSWRFVELPPDAALASVTAVFVVNSGPPVRMALLEKSQIERWVAGRRHSPVSMTPAGFRNALHEFNIKAGDYAIAIENPDPTLPADVHLLVSLYVPGARELPRKRQLAVIAISFSAFFGLVTLSAARLWRATKT